MLFQRKVEKIINENTFLVDRKVGGTRIVRVAGICGPRFPFYRHRDAINKLNRLIGGKVVTIEPLSGQKKKYIHQMMR
jgi:hypothetical protein